MRGFLLITKNGYGFYFTLIQENNFLDIRFAGKLYGLEIRICFARTKYNDLYINTAYRNASSDHV